MDKPVLTFENISKMYELRLLYKNVHFACIQSKRLLSREKTVPANPRS